MTETLALARRKGKRRGSGEGRTTLPLRRKYVRAVIEQRTRGGEQMGSTRTPEEIEEIRATMAMPVADRIARMEAFIDDLDREAAITGEGTPEMRLSGARLLEQEAVRLTQSGDADDYPSAVRRAVGSVNVEREDDVLVREMGRVYDGGEDELRAAVERRMQADPENYER